MTSGMVTEFQFLIGTLKTVDKYLSGCYIDLFQFLIGTLKNGLLGIRPGGYASFNSS